MEDTSVYMRPPDGGAPEKVTAEEIGKRMWNGWVQCDPPAAAEKKEE